MADAPAAAETCLCVLPILSCPASQPLPCSDNLTQLGLARRKNPARQQGVEGWSMNSGDERDAPKTWLVRVRGRVQGVGYRDACVRHARSLGVVGWVRNRLDGSVEAILQGRSEQLAQMRDWLRTGVPTATVDDLEVTTLQPAPTRFDRFERRATE
jgi:acylphosphatase